VKRRVLTALAILLAAWGALGVRALLRRAARRAEAPVAGASDLRGAYHVHTTASDGRGTLDEVARAAAEAGLGFLVVTDHNRLEPPGPRYLHGVLIVPGTEASTRYGHVVALGVPRALEEGERDGDPLGAIRTLGGAAVLAHPLHPRRPFTGWGSGPWRGLEVVSNDAAWYQVLDGHALGKALSAALVLPWDPARALLDLAGEPAAELGRFDAEVRAARAAGEPGPAARVLLCSADAHGYPSYRAAFEAFSMHLPVRLSGDAPADARAVTAALLDGSAACVLDAVAPAASVRLERTGEGGLLLRLEAPDLARAAVRVVRDGAATPGPPLRPSGTRAAVSLCAGRCAPGDYRVEVRRGDQPWIFTNPVRIE